MKKTADSQYDAAASISQDKIAERAKSLWESYGCPSGRDTEIWLEAERQLLGVDPQIEGSGGISVSAAQFDQAVAGEQPVVRESDSSSQRRLKSEPAAARKQKSTATTSAPRQIKSKTKVADDAPKSAKSKGGAKSGSAKNSTSRSRR